VSAADWTAIALLSLLLPWIIVTGWRSLRRWRGTGE
jgi:hypothetical protein